MNVNHIWKGGLAGLLASIVTSLVMLIKREVGFYQDLNPIEMLANSLHFPQVIYAWYLHYLLGIIYGIVFSILYYRIPGDERFRGIVFATCIWFIMMISVMPISGMGVFAMNIGSNFAMFTFIMHLVYGIFVGIIYGWLDKR